MFATHTLSRLLLCIASVKAFVPFPRGCSTTERQAIDDAVDEVVAMANNAVKNLQNFKVDTKEPAFINGALEPLFPPTAISKLVAIYGEIATIKTAGRDVIFYCSEAHVKFGKNQWVDTDYDASVKVDAKRVKKTVPVNIGGTDPQASPGTKGSYTTLGFKPNDDVDFSNQAHVFINKKRLTPNPKYDQRPFATVVKDGLNAKFNNLDGMKPLSETVFHELLHVVGGTASPSSSKLIIRDGPNKDTYGYVKCVELNLNGPSGASLVTADCIFILAKALFLQIKNEKNDPTFWSTGIVDPVALTPIDVPADKSKTPPTPEKPKTPPPQPATENKDPKPAKRAEQVDENDAGEDGIHSRFARARIEFKGI